MLPQDAKNALGDKKVLDFGMRVQSDTFIFGDTHCVTPTSLVLAYAFAVFGSGKAKSLYLAGFDGYPGEDARNEEMNSVIRRYTEEDNSVRLTSHHSHQGWLTSRRTFTYCFHELFFWQREA